MAKSERSSLSILIVSILLGAIFLRLFFIQIINGDEYNQISSNNFLKEIIVLERAAKSENLRGLGEGWKGPNLAGNSPRPEIDEL